LAKSAQGFRLRLSNAVERCQFGFVCRKCHRPLSRAWLLSLQLGLSDRPACHHEGARCRRGAELPQESFKPARLFDKLALLGREGPDCVIQTGALSNA
jgi:hypothetical protein